MQPLKVREGGGRYAYLEAAPSAWRTREAVKSKFIPTTDALQVQGQNVNELVKPVV
jgi:hypothetical protein